MIKNVNFLFVTLFGIGTIRYAPGTITSLITTTFLFSSFHIFNISNAAILISLLLIFFYSFYAVAYYIKDASNKDPKEVVIDEVIGQSIPIYLYEIAYGAIKDSQESIFFYMYIFILFRFFDIKKPFPVSYFDKKFKNSFGVIMDDVVAGLYVVIILIIFIFINSRLFS
ncbi:MAG: phosphatidylglycerophosphatase A [Pelagibacterales bacterium]|jgi:phosphatidylglycerophosphatase A|nr:phosphatidylglycerophosphatase A [Pelagibacterales bacterium]